jgi:hypothetical protein
MRSGRIEYRAEVVAIVLTSTLLVKKELELLGNRFVTFGRPERFELRGHASWSRPKRVL